MISTHSLNLARINLHDANPSGNQLLAQAVREAADGGLGGAVDASSGVRLAASDAADVDNVACSAVGTGQVNGQHGLGHVDEACHVGVEHDADVLFEDLGCFCDWWLELG